MPSINLLDPSLGIQTIMESPAATRGGIPEARPLASNVLREAGLEELYSRRAAATLAAIETDRGNAEKALQLLHRVMDGQTLSTRHAALHLLRARALWQQGRKDEARAAVNEYLYLAGNGPSAQALAEPPFNSMGKRV